MRRLLLVGAFVAGAWAVLATGVPARALAIALPVVQGPQRVAQAEAIVVGRVVALEDKDVKVGEQMYRVAVVQVTEAIKGTKEQMVKVGFIAPPVNQPNPGGPVIRPGIRPRPGFGGPQYTIGQDGLFFLSKGPDGGKFYTTPMFGTFVASQDGNFKQDREQTKSLVKIGNNAPKFLKSENAEERTLAATLLITQYRQFRQNAKQEPISAEESKLILKALAKANWEQNAGPRGFNPNHPYNLFSQL